MEEVALKLEKDRAHSPGRWTSAWRAGRWSTHSVFGAVLWWEVTLGSEQAQTGEP